MNMDIATSIEWIKDWIKSDKAIIRANSKNRTVVAYYTQVIKVYETATEALKKQEPQRVIKPEYEYICKCPSCGCSVLDCNYCKYCGQQLDWGDEK